MKRQAKQLVGLAVVTVASAVVFVAGAQASIRPNDRAGTLGAGTELKTTAVPDVFERAAARAAHENQAVRPDDRAGARGVGTERPQTAVADVFERAFARAHANHQAVRPDDRGGSLGVGTPEVATASADRQLASSAISDSAFPWGLVMGSFAVGLALAGGAAMLAGRRRSGAFTH